MKNQVESLSAPLAHGRAAELTRREFLDVLAKTTVVTAAFSIAVFAGGCGSGNSNSQYT